MSRIRNYLNQMWVLGRQSERAYLRLYPNPGFMLPFGSKRLVVSWHKGVFIRPRGSRQQNPKWVAAYKERKG